MFNNVLLNRVIFVGVTFFVLVVSAQLYRWHVRCTTAAALAQATPAMQQLENENEKHIAQDAGVHIGTNRMGETEMPIEGYDPQTMCEDTGALPKNQAPEPLDIAEAFLLHETMEENSR